MNSRDKDALELAKLYLEFTVNEDELFDKNIRIAANEVLLGQTYPFSFVGELEEGFGEEDLTVAGMPIKDYQVKNIVNAIKNETLRIDAPDKDPQYSERSVHKLIQIMLALVERGEKQGQPFEAPPHQGGKPTPRMQ